MNGTGTLKGGSWKGHEEPFVGQEQLQSSLSALRDVGNTLPALHYSSNSEIFMKKLLLIMIVLPWGDVAEVCVHWAVRVVVEGSISP